MHHVAQVQPEMVHYPGEDVIMTQLLLDYGGDTNVPTKEVTNNVGCNIASRSSCLLLCRQVKLHYIIVRSMETMRSWTL